MCSSDLESKDDNSSSCCLVTVLNGSRIDRAVADALGMELTGHVLQEGCNCDVSTGGLFASSLA